MTITIDVGGSSPAVTPAPSTSEECPMDLGDVTYKLVPLDENKIIFVDITAYKSKNYYVLGEVVKPGRLPYTGCETVLDALQFAGGLLPTADPRNVRLARPGRGGKPAKVYEVDLEAIQKRGDARANYQLFPGDRLMIGWGGENR